MTTTTICPDKDTLVACLYDEATPAERERFETHLAGCAACRDELDALTRVRADLTFWQAPEPSVPVRLVADVPPPSPWAWIRTPAFGLAAAAMLVVGFAAGLARIEVRHDAAGWTLRTGWGASSTGDAAGLAARGQTPGGAAAEPASTTAASTRGDASVPLDAPSSVAPPAALAVSDTAAFPGEAAWRAELAALESRLREELATRDAALARAGDTGASTTRGSGPMLVALTPEMRRQIQTMIDESEVRQQRNLALRVAEVTRDFDLARRSDLLRIQQGLGRVEGRSEAEAARTRDLMNYIMRVSQQGPGQ